MSSERKVLTVWTCDVCGHVETVDDMGSGYPTRWTQAAIAAVTAKLGNVTAKHLCTDCSELLALFMERRLGDAGDLALAWDEGYRTACRDHSNYASCETGDHGQHNANPYRQEADQ